jgi:hypothetical protein
MYLLWILYFVFCIGIVLILDFIVFWIIFAMDLIGICIWIVFAMEYVLVFGLYFHGFCSAFLFELHFL